MAAPLGAALFCAGVAFAQDAAPDTSGKLRDGIRVVMSDELPPFVMTNEDGANEGERADLWALWSQRTGIPVTFLYKPWPDVLGALKDGEADVADVISPTPERSTLFDFGPTYADSPTALFFRKELVGVHDIGSVRGMTVGALGNSICAERLLAAGVTLRTFPSMHDLIYTAVVDRLPVFCLQAQPAAYLLSRAGIAGDYRRTDPIFTTTLHWAVRKGDTPLLDIVNEGFRLIGPQEVAAVSQRWNGQLVPGMFRYRPDQIVRALEALSAGLITALLTALFLRWRLGRSLARQARVEDMLRQRVREQTCLYEVFLATDDMNRPMPEVLRDIAKALRKGFAGKDAPLLRIELLGQVHDELGDRDRQGAISAPVLIEGVERGRIIVAPATPGGETEADSLLLGLVASRIGGRALGATALALLRKSEERFHQTFQHSAQATAIIQEGRFVNANRAALAMLGYDEDGTGFIGKMPHEISPPFQPDGAESRTRAEQVTADVLRNGSTKFEWEHLRRDGESVLLEVLLTAVTEEGRTDIFVLWNDVTVKRQAEAALAAYQQTLEAQVAKRTQQLTDLYDEMRAIFTTATAGVALVRDRAIVTCNPSLASLLLWPHDHLIGCSTRAFFKDDASWREGREAAYDLIASGGVYDNTTELVRFDGSTVWVRLRASAVDPKDMTKGTVWVLEDISLEHAAQARLAEARDLALQAARLKSEFLAQMSHELRSPINAVLGFTELLLGTELDKHQRDFLQKVQTSGRHLLLIVNDVLDLSKVEAGKLRIEQAEFSLPAMLRGVIDNVSNGIAEKNLELILDVDPTLPQRLIGDSLRITQILMNYLTNALKFTETGTITLSVTRDEATAPDAQPRLRFSVTDSGIGMSPEQVARMFQSFSQADDSTARLYGGTGLGLSICRQLAILMQGEVGVSSLAGLGSTFWASLPLPLVGAPPPYKTKRLAGRRILVIDDHIVAGTQLSATLRRNGADVTSVTSGAEAIALLTAPNSPFRPEAMLVDYKMPDLDGVETIRRLHAALGADTPPAILMTKQGRQRVIDLTFAEGIEDLILKPIETDILIDRLEQLPKPGRPATGGRRRARANTPPAAPLAPASPFAGRRALVVDDHPLNRELAAAMLTKHGIVVETAENGAEALERVLASDFDLIFIDNQMPVMGGLEATRRIRALPTDKSRVPIIGLTGRSEDSDRQEGLDLGMNDYIVKPISPVQLRAVLTQWLGVTEAVQAG